MLSRPFLLRNSNSRAPKIKSIIFFLQDKLKSLPEIKSVCAKAGLNLSPYHMNHMTSFGPNELCRTLTAGDSLKMIPEVLGPE